MNSAGQLPNASCTGHPGAHGPTASELLVNPPNVPALSASHVLTVPGSEQARPPWTVSPPAVPMPSTPLSSGTAVPADAVEYSQFSDSYRPVPEVAVPEFAEENPAAAYPTASVIMVFAAEVPGSAGAVPSTARFPFTAPCQVVPSVPVVGVRVEQVPPLDGSPITSAAYPSNCDADIPCHAGGVTCVTV